MDRVIYLYAKNCTSCTLRADISKIKLWCWSKGFKLENKDIRKNKDFINDLPDNTPLPTLYYAPSHKITSPRAITTKRLEDLIKND